MFVLINLLHVDSNHLSHYIFLSCILVPEDIWDRHSAMTSQGQLLSYYVQQLQHIWEEILWIRTMREP